MTSTSPATVYATFAATAHAAPDDDFLCIEARTAAAYGIAPGVLRYGEALRMVETLRERYARAGYGPGHRAGLLLDNRPAFFLHWFALNALGVGVVPINSDLRSAELRYLVEHSEMCLAIVLPERRADLQAFTALAVVGPDDDAVPSAPTIAPSETAIDATTECALLYTSGTTGRPKGCVLSNAYFTGAGRWYAQSGGLSTLRPRAERLITPLPLSHMNAMAFSTMAMVVTGGCLIQLDRFHPSTWWQSVRASGATVVHYLGVMPAMLLGAASRDDDRSHAVRFGFGAGVDPRQQAAFESRFGLPLLEAWAMTETGPGAVIIDNHEPRGVGQASFGRAAPDVECRLVPDAGVDVAVREAGELWVRAAGDDPRRGFFTEYLKDPTATAEAWAHGWFHTGDLVRRDADGNLYFVDRKKNVIRRSGENISAVEVESVLAQHPAVKAVAVAATPDAVRGDEVLACVVLHADDASSHDAVAREILARELVELALDQLAYFKAPGYVAFVDALPLTVSQKIQRGELKAMARTLPGQAHCIDTQSMKKHRA